MILASGVESCVLGGGFIPGPVSTVLGTLHCRCGVFRLTKGKPFPPPPHTLSHTHTQTHTDIHTDTHTPSANLWEVARGHLVDPIPLKLGKTIHYVMC